MGKSDVNRRGSGTVTCFTPEKVAAWLCSVILLGGVNLSSLGLRLLLPTSQRRLKGVAAFACCSEVCNYR